MIILQKYKSKSIERILIGKDLKPILSCPIACYIKRPPNYSLTSWSKAICQTLSERLKVSLPGIDSLVLGNGRTPIKTIIHDHYKLSPYKRHETSNYINKSKINDFTIFTRDTLNSKRKGYLVKETL